MKCLVIDYIDEEVFREFKKYMDVDLMMLPEGCAFASRCTKCMKCCLSRNPEMVEVGPGHSSRCWLAAIEQAGQEETA